MFVLLLVLLLPVWACAQPEFGPIRLDDSLDVAYYNPFVDLSAQGDIRFVWSSSSDLRIGLFAQYLALDGSPVGLRLTYEENAPGTTCAPQMRAVPLSDGGEARLIYHS